MEDAITVEETKRRLDRSGPTLAKMADAGMLRRVTGGYRAQEVHQLECQRGTEFVPWNVGDDLYLAVATTTMGGWDSNLRLSPGNYRAVAEKALGLAPEGCDITGWWSVKAATLDQLVNEQAIIVSLVGGYVREAGRIRDGFKTFHPDRSSLCAFVYEPLSDAALSSVLGQMRGYIRPGGRLVTRRTDMGSNHVVA